MSEQFMNTREVAEYLDIHEKQVYALIKAGKIPCTRVTGKWLFKKDIIDQWIADNTARGEAPDTSRDGVILAAGSNDPVLDILLNTLRQNNEDLRIFSSSVGSTAGLQLLGQGVTSIAWCHLHDPHTGAVDMPLIMAAVGNRKIAVVHLFYRQIGLVSSLRPPRPIRQAADLAAPGVVMVNRQKGSGTRRYLDHLLAEKSIDSAHIAGYDREVLSHLEVGLAILAEEANAGIASVAVARLCKLQFTPLLKESFDMVISQETFFSRPVQAFIQSLSAPAYRKTVSVLGNYDFEASGSIIQP